MANNVDWDTKSLFKGLDALEMALTKAAHSAIDKIANEVLRLSTFEVPHDTGMLQSTGKTEPVSEDEIEVGYNKEYAARLHEHPEYRFQKGRKGHYLIDPIVKNLGIFQKFTQDEVNKSLS